MTARLEQPSTERWLRPADLVSAAASAAAGTTVVGGGAALASAAFPHALGAEALDLEPLDLTTCNPPLVAAMLTLDRLAADPVVASGWPAITEAARLTATPEVRRLATIGGTVAARVPTADLPSALCAHGASVHLHDGERAWTMLLHDYLVGPAPAALITGIDLGQRGPSAYRRLAGRPGPAPAIAAVAGILTPVGLQLWAGAVAAQPIPFDGVQPPARSRLRDDDRASAAYRHRVLRVLADEVRAQLEETT
jgi:CO/xanthine dehydrogenase FAD-binding subunit